MATLRQLFVTRYGEPESDGFKRAQEEFSKSLAAYSILMYLLLLRDRHNGNLMLDGRSLQLSRAVARGDAKEPKPNPNPHPNPNPNPNWAPRSWW